MWPLGCVESGDTNWWREKRRCRTLQEHKSQSLFEHHTLHPEILREINICAEGLLRQYEVSSGCWFWLTWRKSRAVNYDLLPCSLTPKPCFCYISALLRCLTLPIFVCVRAPLSYTTVQTQAHLCTTMLLTCLLLSKLIVRCSIRFFSFNISQLLLASNSNWAYN